MFLLHTEQTGWVVGMAPTSFVMGSVTGRVQPKSYKTDPCRYMAWRSAWVKCYVRTWTGWFCVRIMWRRRISSNCAYGMVSQYGKTIKLPSLLVMILYDLKAAQSEENIQTIIQTII